MFKELKEDNYSRKPGERDAIPGRHSSHHFDRLEEGPLDGFVDDMKMMVARVMKVHKLIG